MIRRGYRVYSIDNVETFEKRAPALAELHSLQIEMYTPFKVVFVKDRRERNEGSM
jgi:hypothetical protein